jgi:hypothetical protein
MQGLTYISAEDRKRLDEILTKINSSRLDPADMEKLQEERRQLESGRKPLSECNVEEAQELKASIFEKYHMLQGIGKTSVARQFLVYMQQIELHMQRLMLEESRKTEEEKLRSKQDQEAKKRRAGSKGNISQSRGSSSWSVDLSNLD